MEILEIWLTQNQNAVMGKNVSSIIFMYVVLCFSIKKPVFLLAFLLPEIITMSAVFDFMTIRQKYAVEVIIYSYVFNKCIEFKSKVCCVIIMLTALLFGYDDFFYGVSGYYGESKTTIYQNIEYINLCAHVLFIGSLISIKRIRHSLRGFLNDVMRITANSDYMHIVRYNISKIRNGTI